MATLKELQNAHAQRIGTMPAKSTIWGTEVIAKPVGPHRLMWVHSKFNKETEAYDTECAGIVKIVDSVTAARWVKDPIRMLCTLVHDRALKSTKEVTVTHADKQLIVTKTDSGEPLFVLHYGSDAIIAR